jgi:ABC-2 type transport system ATP-binding protein
MAAGKIDRWRSTIFPSARKAILQHRRARVRRGDTAVELRRASAMSTMSGWRIVRARLTKGNPMQAATAPAESGVPAPIVSVSGLGKTYKSGFQALKNVDLTIRRGEIFALLGPNGAGKTTLISIICGIVRASEGSVTADGHDIVRDYRAARTKIGLVPQELHTGAFESVWATVSFSRGLFGKAADPTYVEKVLRDLSLWDKKDSKIAALSGGMKRRVLIAKALAHEPTILFLDEPTAGVDVELRRDMWQMVRALRARGVTIILTTHYIEEAEEMADRIGVIRQGELILVEDKDVLMRKLGKKQLTLQLQNRLAQIPAELAALPLELSEDGLSLIYTFDTQGEETGIAGLLRRLGEHGIDFKDLHSSESSLEEIFVGLLRSDAGRAAA